MLIFIDVGAHYGETVDLALDPAWGFHQIYAFEPARACLDILSRFRVSRLTVVPAGMSNGDRRATLYGAGLLGASVYADKRQADTALEQETVPLVRATDWLLAHTSPDDDVCLKLNCEGSECDVLEDLLDSGAIDRVRSVFVDFDVRKIPSQAHRQDGVERRLRERGVDFVTPDTLGRTGNAAVHAWLTRICAPSNRRAGQLRYRLRLHRPAYLWATSVARATLPDAVFRQVARRFGANARLRAKKITAGR